MAATRSPRSAKAAAWPTPPSSSEPNNRSGRSACFGHGERERIAGEHLEPRLGCARCGVGVDGCPRHGFPPFTRKWMKRLEHAAPDLPHRARVTEQEQG